MRLNKNDRIVFAGDSVTDDGRARPIGEGLWGGTGNGYVRNVETFLTSTISDLSKTCTIWVRLITSYRTVMTSHRLLSAVSVSSRERKYPTSTAKTREALKSR